MIRKLVGSINEDTAILLSFRSAPRIYQIASRIQTEQNTVERTVQCTSRKEVLVKEGRRLTCTLSEILDKSHWPLCAAMM